MCRPFREEKCCANDPAFWRRLAVAQHMLGFVQGENSKDILTNYLRQANVSAYHAIKIGANDSDTFTWCALLQPTFTSLQFVDLRSVPVHALVTMFTRSQDWHNRRLARRGEPRQASLLRRVHQAQGTPTRLDSVACSLGRFLLLYNAQPLRHGIELQ